MCGIAGAAWTNEAEPVAPETVRRMLAVLSHRGPDDWGLYVSTVGADEAELRRRPSSRTGPSGSAAAECEVGRSSSPPAPAAVLGHRRLSIIDVVGGHQPLPNEDRTVWLVLNGEVYNYRELRQELLQRGHRFVTRSDAEVVVHLYEERGADCVHRLRGMFAFAVWDDRRKRLLLARDRLGQKPLFYWHQPGRVVFASELKALLQVPGFDRRLSWTALDLYLAYQYVPHPHCIFEACRKLSPAHRAVFEGGRLRVERYWSPPGVDGVAVESEGDGRGQAVGRSGESTRWLRRTLRPDDWLERLRHELTEAVRLRLRSDVPLGAFLSGGVDSTVVVGLMQRLCGEPVKTFSIGFPVREFDERRYARQVARFLGTDHHEQLVEPNAVLILPRLVWHYDEPYADSSAIPTLLLAELTRQHVKVVLSGDGGDELFAGYERYAAVQLSERLKRLPLDFARLASSRLLSQLTSSPRKKTWRRRVRRFLKALPLPTERRYYQWMSIFDDEQRQQLYSAELAAELDGQEAADFLLQNFARCAGDPVTRTLLADQLTYLPCDLLTKVDVATMAHGLECRSPFLDHQVVELADRMPPELKLRWGRGKRVLVEAFRELVPRAVRRRRKMGFGVPLDHWFRQELRPLLLDVVLSPRAVQRGFFREEAVRRLVDEHLVGVDDHSPRLWALLCLELWLRTFVDPAVPPSQPPSSDTRW